MQFSAAGVERGRSGAGGGAAFPELLMTALEFRMAGAVPRKIINAISFINFLSGFAPGIIYLLHAFYAVDILCAHSHSSPVTNLFIYRG